MVADNYQFLPFFFALPELAGPFEAYVRALSPRPSCIIADWMYPWTAGVAKSLGIPRLFFHGLSFFFSLCDLQAANHGLHERIAAGGDEDKHSVPGVPVPVTVTRATAPGFLNHPAMEVLRDAAMEAMRTADGFVVNTFLDLEAQFVACYEVALGKPVWVVGPLSLCNRDVESTASRGRTAAAGCQQAITAWLDGQAPGSVVFVSFGSIARKLPRQLVEVGHGLEDPNRPFLWVVKETEASAPGVQEWLEALEARTAGRGLVVRGWVPQLAVLVAPRRRRVRDPLRVELAAGVHRARRASGDVAALRRPVPERAAGRGGARRGRVGRHDNGARDDIRGRNYGGASGGRRAGGVGADGRRGGGRREEAEGQGVRGESSQGHGGRRVLVREPDAVDRKLRAK